MKKTVRWVQEDWLRADETEPAVFVFDERTVNGYSLKRIQFIYECLMELPVEIRFGRYEEQVAGFAAGHGAEVIVTATAGLDSRARAAMNHLRERFALKVEDPEPFVTLAREPDLKRFSRYWSLAEPLLVPRKARGT